MINPIPKQGMYATLNANEVAEMIAAMSNPIDRNVAYAIYFGTVNHCSTIIDETLAAYRQSDVTPTEDQDGISDVDRPVITNRRPDW